MIREVLKEIEKRRSFLLTSHARPDGDAVGSALGFAQILHSMGKRADVALSDGVPYIYRLLPHSNSVIAGTRVKNDYDAVILLECESVQRTRLEGLERHFLINIDHHVSAKPFANLNWIDPTACATAEVLFRLAKQAGVAISTSIATCLYTAILTDTGAFCFVGTTERTFVLAQELVRAGADPSKIAQSVYFSNPLSKMRVLGVALSSLHREGALTWMHLTRDAMGQVGATDQDCEGLVNYALAIEGVEVAMFFREQEGGRLRVSLRSKGNVNVAGIAEYFGGGGHECASGFSVEGPLSLATERVLAQVRMRAGDLRTR